LQSAAEIFLKNIGRNDFLTLLSLWTCLSVVFTHVRIIGSNKTNDRLFTFVANIDTNKHGLVGNFLTKVHSPEITSKLSIDLSDNVEVDAVIISHDSFACDKLRDDRVIRVNFIFNGRVESLLSQTVRNND